MTTTTLIYLIIAAVPALILVVYSCKYTVGKVNSGVWDEFSMIVWIYAAVVIGGAPFLTLVFIFNSLGLLTAA